MASQLVFYQGRDSSRCIKLEKQDCDTGMYQPIDLSPVLEIQIYFLSQLYSSIDNPNVFDISVDPLNGRLDMKLGLITQPQIIPIGKDRKVELILVDPSNPNGLPMDDLLFVDMRELT